MKAALNMPFVVLLVALLLVGCGERSASSDPDLAAFVKSKQTQAKALAEAQNVKTPGGVDKLFNAILADDWPAATNLFARLNQTRFGPPAAPTPIQRVKDWFQERLQKFGLFKPKRPFVNSEAWQPMAEAYSAYEISKTWQRSHIQGVVRNITAAIGTNSMYFGGTDAGRFAITAAMQSHQEGRPCFVLTQNALADQTYLAYLASMFSNHIYVPTPTDSQQAFQNYLTDVQRRVLAGKLKKGETVITTGGRLQVSGTVAVMEINALLVKVIFDNNTNREFYIEQSWPLSWTYPHLVPVGPILKINREPLDQLPDSVVLADRAFWSNKCAMLIGDWIRPETSVREVCEFAEQAYVKHSLSNFKGDPQYLQDRSAQEYFSKLRAAVADVYFWRSNETKSSSEQQRMLNESLLAFQQAFALGPANYDVTEAFIGTLARMNRLDDAERLATISITLNPTNATLKAVIENLKIEAIRRVNLVLPDPSAQ